jgi:hypothetical protein
VQKLPAKRPFLCINMFPLHNTVIVSLHCVILRPFPLIPSSLFTSSSSTVYLVRSSVSPSSASPLNILTSPLLHPFSSAFSSLLLTIRDFLSSLHHPSFPLHHPLLLMSSICQVQPSAHTTRARLLPVRRRVAAELIAVD